MESESEEGAGTKPKRQTRRRLQALADSDGSESEPESESEAEPEAHSEPKAGSQSEEEEGDGQVFEVEQILDRRPIRQLIAEGVLNKHDLLPSEHEHGFRYFLHWKGFDEKGRLSGSATQCLACNRSFAYSFCALFCVSQPARGRYVHASEAHSYSAVCV